MSIDSVPELDSVPDHAFPYRSWNPETDNRGPLRWKDAERIRVNDRMIRSGSLRVISDAFGVMAATPQHTYELNTTSIAMLAAIICVPEFWLAVGVKAYSISNERNTGSIAAQAVQIASGGGLPLRNVWIGTSVETQSELNASVPYLLKCPAVIRFLHITSFAYALELEASAGDPTAEIPGRHWLGPPSQSRGMNQGVDWVRMLGAVGQRTKPGYIENVFSLVDQCKYADVPVWIERLGSSIRTRCSNTSDGWPVGTDIGLPVSDVRIVRLRSQSGSDPREWPAQLQKLRQWPEIKND